MICERGAINKWKVKERGTFTVKKVHVRGWTSGRSLAACIN